MIFLVFAFPGWAQSSDPISLSEALVIAKSRNLQIQSVEKSLKAAEELRKSGFDLEKTQVFYGYDKNDLAENGIFNRVAGIRQSFAFPSLYTANRGVFQAQAEKSQANFRLAERQLEKDVSLAYVEAAFWRESLQNLEFLDSLYGAFAQAAHRRFELGESNLLEKLTAESKQREIQLRKNESEQEYQIVLLRLKELLNWEGDLIISSEPIDLPMPEAEAFHPLSQWYQAGKEEAQLMTKQDRRKLLPDVSLEVFRGTNPGPDAQVYPGFQAGIGIPLFFGAQKARISSGQFREEQVAFEADAFELKLERKKLELNKRLAQSQNVLDYYSEEGRDLADQLQNQAHRSFREGEIDFLQFVQLIENARNITLQYLESKLENQQNLLELTYLTF
ncbi:TolC family protein [Algoriphagus hitonicola]